MRRNIAHFACLLRAAKTAALPVASPVLVTARGDAVSGGDCRRGKRAYLAFIRGRYKMCARLGSDQPSARSAGSETLPSNLLSPTRVSFHEKRGRGASLP